MEGSAVDTFVQEVRVTCTQRRFKEHSFPRLGLYRKLYNTTPSVVFSHRKSPISREAIEIMTKSRWLFWEHVLSQVTAQSSGPQPCCSLGVSNEDQDRDLLKEAPFLNVRRHSVKCAGTEWREKIQNIPSSGSPLVWWINHLTWWIFG